MLLLIAEVAKDFPDLPNEAKFVFNSLLGEMGIEMWVDSVPADYVEE